MTDVKSIKMKKKINVQLMGIATVAIFATLLLVVVVFYDLFQKQIIEDLRTYTHILKTVEFMNEEAVEEYDASLDNLRITLINRNGEVLFDNYADSASMRNHGDRPEVLQAFTNGEGTDIRRSETLAKNTFYYAVLLEDGNVLRVAKEANSIVSVFASSIPMIILIALFLIAASTALAHFLTKSLVQPIERMANDMDHIGKIEAYEELIPFINTINRQHQDILKSSKMRQEFTANVSHELKTPLTSISGYSELIETGMASESDTRRFAGEIHHNANRLLTLINDIIRLSELDITEEKEDATFENVDLYLLAQNCVDMLQVNAENHGITLYLEGGSGIVSGNRLMLEEVLYNLCDNAIRYNNEGGKVRVMVSPTRDRRVILSVKDNGIGISKEHQERIFERFYRVDKSRSKKTGGTGLGLAIVKHIIAHHGAELSIESEIGKGTEITITFKGA